MEIIIPLPQIDSSTNTYQELKSYLKQLELAVHHAQKSVENAEKDGVEISEDSFICFQHPALESSLKLDAETSTKEEVKKTLDSLMDSYYAELQSIELRINLE